jgi:hypothetical protein
MINGQRFPRRKMVQDIYSSRTYVRIRRMVLVSLCGANDLSSIMSDTDSDDGAHDLIMR